jgi:hypothetical protein
MHALDWIVPAAEVVSSQVLTKPWVAVASGPTPQDFIAERTKHPQFFRMIGELPDGVVSLQAWRVATQTHSGGGVCAVHNEEASAGKSPQLTLGDCIASLTFARIP